MTTDGGRQSGSEARSLPVAIPTGHLSHTRIIGLVTPRLRTVLRGRLVHATRRLPQERTPQPDAIRRGAAIQSDRGTLFQQC
jgi:hypothetical protein